MGLCPGGAVGILPRLKLRSPGIVPLPAHASLLRANSNDVVQAPDLHICVLSASEPSRVRPDESPFASPNASQARCRGPRNVTRSDLTFRHIEGT